MSGKAHFSRFLLVASVALLPGCQSMDAAMTSMGNSFAKLDFTDRDKAAAGNSGDVAAAAGDAAPAEIAAIAQPVDCPRVGMVDDLDKIHQFTEGKPFTDDNAISTATITKIDSLCSINDTNVIVDMDIHVAGTLGKRGKMLQADKPSFAYPYFIAITTPNGNITSKEVFAATMSFPADSDSEEHTEQMRQVIPLSGEYIAKDYEILVGFQLTPEELEYNRKLGEAAPPATAPGM
jgi:hypothetical protein